MPSDTTITVLILLTIVLFLNALLYLQRSKAQKALEVSNTKLQTIFDITMEAIIIYDEHHRIK
jgi:PAS domain-containing protein